MCWQYRIEKDKVSVISWGCGYGSEWVNKKEPLSWWGLPGIPALWKPRQENQRKLEAVASSRPEKSPL